MAFQVAFCQSATKLNKLSPIVQAVFKSDSGRLKSVSR